MQTKQIPANKQKRTKVDRHPSANCFYMDERKIMMDKFKEITDSIENLKENVDPIIELKNGSIHQKKVSEAVKESWEQIHKIQTKLEVIDNRTVVLEDMNSMMSNYKEFKTRGKKYFIPILKALIFIGFFYGFIKYLIIERPILFEIVKWVYGA